jgi:hypothetical protein
MAKIEIPTENIEKNFDAYLSPDSNARIIFSGIFGIGKTTFLKRYFEKRRSQYFHIHLFPVNYSVSSNEDIFELIKCDILYELFLFPDLKIPKLKARFGDVLFFMDKVEVIKAFRPFVDDTSKIGKAIKPIVSTVEKIIALYKHKKDQVAKDTEKDIELFFKQFQDKKGNIYETDFYTQLIRGLIKEIQASNIKVVVTIDDLDRIDPEHIFRILNVFGAHLDYDHSVNKFGIDKIITCCHIKNIRNIFTNKYGQDVDFSGYIDKFYSVGIYEFSNSLSVESQIENIFDNIAFKDTHFLNRSNYRQLAISLLNCFFQSGSLNLRTLLKYSSAEFQVPLKYLRIPNYNRSIYMHQVPIYVVLDFFASLFGSVDSLLLAVDNSNFSLRNIPKEERYIADLILAYHLQEFNFDDLYGNPLIKSTGKWGTSRIQINYDSDGNGNIVHLWGTIQPSEGQYVKPTASFHKEILRNAIVGYSLITLM